jgi:hypothetical protein
MHTLKYRRLEKRENELVFIEVVIGNEGQQITLPELSMNFQEYLIAFSTLAKKQHHNLDEGVSGSRGIRPRG